MRIGILSDTHGFLHPGIFSFMKDCDEIWHAGDIGNEETYKHLTAFKPVRAVYGNIDGQDLRQTLKKTELFGVENVNTLMTHIGGYPGRYEKEFLEILRSANPKLAVCGHSHICRVQYDKKHDLLFVNPGAAGKFGFHLKITMVRLEIAGSEIRNCEIFETSKHESADSVG